MQEKFEYDRKFYYFLISIVITVISLVYEINETYHGRVIPHPYTWLVWFFTQGIATYASWKGKGGWQAVGLGIGTILVFFVFLFSIFTSGLSLISTFDTVMLLSALTALGLMFILKKIFPEKEDPADGAAFDISQYKGEMVAVLMISLTDFIGYIPSFENAWLEPQNESILVWLGITLSIIFGLAAARNFNRLTITYDATLLAGSLIMVALLVF